MPGMQSAVSPITKAITRKAASGIAKKSLHYPLQCKYIISAESSFIRLSLKQDSRAFHSEKKNEIVTLRHSILSGVAELEVSVRLHFAIYVPPVNTKVETNSYQELYLKRLLSRHYAVFRELKLEFA